MKNVTITVEDAVLEWVRIEAAKLNSSVSRLVGEMLAEKMRRDDAYVRAMQEWKTDRIDFESDGNPLATRDAIYAERLDRFR